MSLGPIPTARVRDVPSPLPGDLAVLDVREHVEWRYGHIEGALHVPLGELPGRLADVPSGPLLVVCKMGGRSAQAVQYLRAAGHEAVNLAGGMLDWSDAGRPMVSETGQDPQVV